MFIKLIQTGPIYTNTYIVADEKTKKAAIIDPGGIHRDVEEIISENGFQVEKILLTHGHSDHMAGVPYYKEKYNAKLYVHEADREIAENAGLNYSKELHGEAITIRADELMNDGDIVTVGDLNFQVLHTPGHTPGGVCFYAENVLFSGDSLFCQSIGRTDFPYSDTQALLAAILKKLWVLPDETAVYPGHMGNTSIGFEKKNNPYL